MSAGTLRPTTLGPYRVVDFLGAGGMGEVYRATHTATGRVAAVKVLTRANTPTMRERFRNEGRIQAGLQHPHIVTLYDLFEVDGLPCLAMEYVAGASLDAIAQRGSIPVPQALAWFAQVADAVAYIHGRGVIHRDLKTSNIRIDEQGRVRLLDFGIAKSGDSPKLTTDGSVVGTLLALAPEQVRGEPATPASDLWALGIVLYEMVTGRTPFAADSITGVMDKILKGTYAPPERPDVPAQVAALIARCLRVDPSQRPRSASELRDAAQEMLRGGPAPTLPAARGPLGLRVAQATAAIAVLLLAITLWPRGPRVDGPELPADTTRLAADTARPLPVDASRLRQVTINVFGETPADVYRDGVRIGTTPARFAAPLGTWVSVSLRRPGYEPLERRFQVHDGANEYTETLRASTTPPPPPSER
ncbi:MAG: serine/threonine protein kinase [Gemmatimonadetes bacterium]|nr:serine/threonine protein kinase [Gemmatimonadota bacterium]